MSMNDSMKVWPAQKYPISTCYITQLMCHWISRQFFISQVPTMRKWACPKNKAKLLSTQERSSSSPSVRSCCPTICVLWRESWIVKICLWIFQERVTRTHHWSWNSEVFWPEESSNSWKMSLKKMPKSTIGGTLSSKISLKRGCLLIKRTTSKSSSSSGSKPPFLTDAWFL